MTPEAIGALVGMGLPGIVIIGLGVAYLRKDAKVDELQEKRVAENRESVKAIESNTAGLEALVELLKDRDGRSNVRRD